MFFSHVLDVPEYLEIDCKQKYKYYKVVSSHNHGIG